MRITTIGTIHILEFMRHTVSVNCVLIEEGDELTLVDTGLPFCYSKIVKAAQTIGKPITKLLVTHPHMDHVGGVARFVAAQPKLEVFLSSKDYSIIKENQTSKKNETKEKNNLNWDVTIIPNHLLFEHDTIGSLEVIATPGHTPGSLSFYHKKLKVMISGDEFQTQGGFAVAGDTRLLFPIMGLATWSLKEAIESAEKLNQYEINILVPGHGKLLRNPREQVEAIIKRAKAR